MKKGGVPVHGGRDVGVHRALRSRELVNDPPVSNRVTLSMPFLLSITLLVVCKQSCTAADNGVSAEWETMGLCLSVALFKQRLRHTMYLIFAILVIVKRVLLSPVVFC